MMLRLGNVPARSRAGIAGVFDSTDLADWGPFEWAVLLAAGWTVYSFVSGTRRTVQRVRKGRRSRLQRRDRLARQQEQQG